jgi:hypothetical protein
MISAVIYKVVQPDELIHARWSRIRQNNLQRIIWDRDHMFQQQQDRGEYYRCLVRYARHVEMLWNSAALLNY